MNSIQFISNQVGRVIGTPPSTPRRYPSSTSLHVQLSNEKSPNNQTDGAGIPGLDVDKLANLLKPDPLASSSNVSDTSNYEKDSDGTRQEETNNAPDVKVTTFQQENFALSVVLFLPRLLYRTLIAPFLWVASSLFPDNGLPLEGTAQVDLSSTSSNLSDSSAYLSIFTSFFNSLFSFISKPANQAHTSKDFDVKSKPSGLYDVHEESDGRRDPGGVSTLRSPYTTFRTLYSNITSDDNKKQPLTPSTTTKTKLHRTKSPSSYALKYPRSCAPPRPLVPFMNFHKGVSSAPSREKKTLVLDLDETLIHSLYQSTAGISQGHLVEVKLPNNQFATLYNLLKRPYCDEFLESVSQWYNLVIFTASVQAYADPMIDWLEKDRKYFQQRFYRQHCTLHTSSISSTSSTSSSPSSASQSLSSSANVGLENDNMGDNNTVNSTLHRYQPGTMYGFTKDLSKVNSDLSKVFIIDNSPISFLHHENNAIEIETWINDPSDTCLLNLIPLLSALRYTTDVRTILSLKSGESMFA